uniref:Ymf63 n=1 Tax=Tetrahymena pigmentosa TaxID=5907 RepID=Q09F19_TETPI|nr:Ymf63 [Tetrahymena pigmentosa]ABI51732.1 Ymf63 [Tetrahymena pigmentosa]
MKQLKKIYLNKIKLIKNKKNFTKKLYKLKLYKLKLFYNFKSNINFYINKLNYFQEHLNTVGLNSIFYINHSSDLLEDRFSTSRYHTFDSYLTSIELINYSNITGKFIIKYKYSMLSYFLPFLLKNGKKLSTINTMLSAISNIYTNLNYNSINNFSNYSYINQFKHYIDKTDDVYNLNFLIHWIINIYKPVFDIKCFNLPKIHKKKSDKSVLFKILYLSDKNRLKTAYKHITINIKKDQANKLKYRIINTFLDMLLNYKKSYLYTRKIYIYEQVMDM